MRVRRGRSEEGVAGCREAICERTVERWGVCEGLREAGEVRGRAGDVTVVVGAAEGVRAGKCSALRGRTVRLSINKAKEGGSRRTCIAALVPAVMLALRPIACALVDACAGAYLAQSALAGSKSSEENEVGAARFVLQARCSADSFERSASATHRATGPLLLAPTTSKPSSARSSSTPTSSSSLLSTSSITSVSALLRLLDAAALAAAPLRALPSKSRFLGGRVEVDGRAPVDRISTPSDEGASMLRARSRTSHGRSSEVSGR